MCELEEEVEKRSEEISNTESPAFSQDPGREGKDEITLGQREILEASQNETDFIAKVNNTKSGDNKEAGGGKTHDTEDAVPATGGTTFFSESFLPDPLPETTLEANCPAVRMRVLPGAYAMQGMSIGVGEPTRLNSSRSTAVGAGMSAEVGAQNAGDVGLVEARLVNAEEGNMPVGVPANEQCKGGKEIKYPALKVLLLLLFVALVSVGIPALVLSNSDENSQAGTEETTIIEDASILSPEEEYLTRYLPEATVATIMSSILDVTTNSNNSSELDNMAMKDEELQYHPQLFAFQWLSLDPGLRKYTKARIRQRFALATFYVTTRGDTWADNKHWLSYDHHECDWHVGWNRPKITSPASVTTESACETLDEIAILSESSNSSSELNGFDPNERMFRRLWFRNNTLNGTIPEELFWLSSLEEIELSYNSMQGQLSDTGLRQLSQLNSLAMPHNDLSGTIPSELGLLTHMTNLYLGNAGAGIQTTIPSEIALLTDLEVLVLSTISLSGTIPTQLGVLSKLNVMAFKNTQLTGPLPSEVGNMSSLMFLNVGSSQLSGTIPSELGNIPNLWWFFAENIQLSGSLPSELGAIASLQELDLSHNSLTSTIPSELGLLPRIYKMDLSHNSITGSVPSTLGNMSAMKHMEMSFNQLSGVLPSEIGSMTKMEIWYSDNNLFSGSIPSEVAMWEVINYLNITGNDGLQGTVPDSLCKIANASFLAFDCTSALCGCMQCACPDRFSNSSAQGNPDLS